MSRLTNRYLLVLGSYAFSVPASSLIHEIGHVLAYLAVGITQFQLVLNPFGASAAMPLVALPEEHMLFLASSGMLFQLVCILAIWLTLGKRTSAMYLPVRTLFPIGLLNIGGYLLGGNIADGDTAIMVQHGAPTILLSILGLVGVISGLVFFTRLMPDIGFSSNESRCEVFTPIFLGMGSYSMIMIGYALMTGYVLWIGAVNLVSSIILALAVTLVYKRTNKRDGLEPTFTDSYRVFLMGTLMVSIIMIVSNRYKG